MAASLFARNCEAGMDIVKGSQSSETDQKTGQRFLCLQDYVHKNSVSLLQRAICAQNTAKSGAGAIYSAEKCKIIVKK